MSVRLAGLVAFLGEFGLLSPEVLSGMDFWQGKILRFWFLTFAQKLGIIFYCDIQSIVMSRTIAGVFDFPLTCSSGKPVWSIASFGCITIPPDKAGRGLKPAGGPLE
jgi:hypothetical protein